MPTMKASELDPGECKGCGALIYWVKMADTGKAMPVDRGADLRVLPGPDGARVVKCYISHFRSCSAAAHFRKVESR
jgi:hypothetical protein